MIYSREKSLYSATPEDKTSPRFTDGCRKWSVSIKDVLILEVFVFFVLMRLVFLLVYQYSAEHSEHYSYFYWSWKVKAQRETSVCTFQSPSPTVFVNNKDPLPEHHLDNQRAYNSRNQQLDPEYWFKRSFRVWDQKCVHSNRPNHNRELSGKPCNNHK